MLPHDALLVLPITLGFSFAVIFSKVSLGEIKPERFAMIYTFGAIVVIAVQTLIFHIMGKASFIMNSGVILILLAAAFGAFAYFFAYTGLKGTAAGISTTVFNLQGPLITFIGALVYRIFPGYPVIAGLLISLVGLFIFGMKDMKEPLKLSRSFVFLSLSPLLWALEWISFSLVSSVSPMFYTFVLYLFIFLMLFITNNVIIRPKLVSSRKARTFAMIGGIFSGIANGSYGIFLSSNGTTLTGLVTLLTVPVSVLLVMATLREKYSLLEMGGIAIIFAGLVVATFL